jgi:hypothetical protein
MKLPRSLIYACLASAAAAAVPPLAHAQADPDSPRVVTAPGQDPALPYIDAIRLATSPSKVAAVYVSGQQAAPQSLSLKSAFIRRMVELGQPELAETQARQLLTHDPNDGLAHAVLAAAAAEQQQLPTALAEIVAAADRLPDDRFVQDLSAQLVAQYDASAKAGGNADLPASLRESINRLTARMGTQPAFREAYAKARGTSGPADSPNRREEERLIKDSGASQLTAGGWTDPGTASQQSPAAAHASQTPNPSPTGTYSTSGYSNYGPGSPYYGTGTAQPLYVLPGQQPQGSPTPTADPNQQQPAQNPPPTVNSQPPEENQTSVQLPAPPGTPHSGNPNVVLPRESNAGQKSPNTGAPASPAAARSPSQSSSARPAAQRSDPSANAPRAQSSGGQSSGGTSSSGSSNSSAGGASKGSQGSSSSSASPSSGGGGSQH